VFAEEVLPLGGQGVVEGDRGDARLHRAQEVAERPEGGEGQEERAVCNLEKASYYQPLYQKIAEVTGVDHAKLTAKLQSITHKPIVDAVFQMQLIHAEETWSRVGFADFSLGQFIVVIEGELLVLGMPSDTGESWSYAERLKQIGSMTPAILQEHLQKGTGFCLRLQPGSIAFVPCQYIVRQHSLKASWCLRWPVYDQSSATESRKILSSCLSAASSYPDMCHGTFQQWMACLQELASST